MSPLELNSRHIDLLMAMDWEYDRDFAALVQEQARLRHLSVLVAEPAMLPDLLARLHQNDLRVHALFDRASDTSEGFVALQTLAAANGAEIIEPLERMRWASDKATMHLEFIANGLYTPYTIIIESFDDNNDIWLSTDELAHLGRPFIIKPANTTGGGVGVVNGAESLHDVLWARRQFSSDKYLLQEKVRPLELDGRRFWFRGFYVFGLVQCVWWNDQTHLYSELTAEDVSRYQLRPLFDITSKISGICRLNFFSTEICLTAQRAFVVVDYVNEACDMRLKSKHVNGVPDNVVVNIAARICKQARIFKQAHLSPPQKM